MDAVTDERGQALALAVLALAFAAVTIVGLRAAQDRILDDARARRAGEAAIEAAGAAVADAHVAFVSALRDETGHLRVLPTRAELDAFAADPSVLEGARVAAAQLALANGGADPHDLLVTTGTRSIELSLTLGTHRSRAAIATPCCRR